jgi:hypothetical protein
MIGSFSPAKIMAVRRAESGFASNDDVPISPGGSKVSQYTGDTKKTWPCSEWQSALTVLTDLYEAKCDCAEK